MKEEETVDDDVPASSLSLSEEDETTMNTLVKVMAPVCAIYDVGFESLVEELELRTRENLSGIMDVVVVDAPYNVCRDVNAENSEPDVFTSKDIKEMAGCITELLKPGANGHIFCLTLQ